MVNRLSLVALLALTLPASALAQGAPTPAPAPAPATEVVEPAVAVEVEEVDLGATFDEDDPNAPDRPSAHGAITVRDLEGELAATTPRATRATFPLEFIERPMTLVARQYQVSLELPLAIGGADAAIETTLVLRAAYGLTQDVQAGISYGFGLARIAPEGSGKGFEAGKAFSIDAAYTLIPDKLAVTASLPFYADPFALSLTAGLPFRLRVYDKLALFGLNDLVELKLATMPVSVSEPGRNIATAAGIDVSKEPPVGHFNLTFGALYQHRANLALTAQMGFFFHNFSSGDQPVALQVAALFAKSKRLDLSARLGVARLDDVASSLVLGFAATFRI